MTDELIEATLQRNADNGGGFCSEVLDYINRLKERIDTAHCENQNLQTYIDNHEEIWKHNAEIDKAIVRKDTAKEIFQRLLKWKSSVIFDTESIVIAEKQFTESIKTLAAEIGVEVDDE